MTEHDDLDDLLARARAAPLVAAPAFMARVLADAEALQPRPEADNRPKAVRAPGLGVAVLRRMIGAFGGAVGVAGVGSAALAGLLIGYVQPEPMLTIADSYGLAASGDAGLDLLSEYDSLLSLEPDE